MITIEDLAGMEQMIRDLEDAQEALPSFIFILKIHLIQAKRVAGITGPILPPVDAPLVEAVAA